MKKEEKKVKNPYISFITTEVVLFYFVVWIGDLVRKAIDVDSMLMTRYLPLGIVAFISMFFLTGSYAKKIYRSNEQAYKMFVKMLPLIMAVIIILFGLYSVAQNSAAIKDDLRYKMYSTMLGDELLNEQIEKAKSSAKTSWMITAAVCLIAGEFGVILAHGKISEKVKEDDAEPVSYNTEETNTNNDDSLSVEKNVATNNIKWDL